MTVPLEEYNSILYGVNDEMAAAGKLEQEQLAKLADLGELQGVPINVFPASCYVGHSETCKNSKTGNSNFSLQIRLDMFTD